mmetsp:Transcript_5043/g.12880  ORF Transcript_5043/g.12880 Transcript_5043/m.12880 type:complete len:199 (+) Transcript_5043:1546-2142(+)
MTTPLLLKWTSFACVFLSASLPFLSQQLVTELLPEFSDPGPTTRPFVVEANDLIEEAMDLRRHAGDASFDPDRPRAFSEPSEFVRPRAFSFSCLSCSEVFEPVRARFSFSEFVDPVRLRAFSADSRRSQGAAARDQTSVDVRANDRDSLRFFSVTTRPDSRKNISFEMVPCSLSTSPFRKTHRRRTLQSNAIIVGLQE